LAQEFQWAWDAVQKDMPGGAPWFSWYRADKRVTCYYAYLDGAIFRHADTAGAQPALALEPEPPARA
jgi:hypothetical protein